MESANWLRLAYKLAESPDSKESKLVRRLPEILSRGASVLEIARKTQSPPDDVKAVLKELEEFDLVRAQNSGLNIASGELYSLTAEGVQFFKHLGPSKKKSAF